MEKYACIYSIDGFVECNKNYSSPVVTAILMNSSDPSIAKIAYESFDQLSEAELNRKTKSVLNSNDKDMFLTSIYQSGINRLNLDLDG